MPRIRKNEKKKKANVHKELDGLDLTINEFGEIIGNKKIEELNQFLNKHVADRKLEDRSGKFGEETADDEPTEAT